MQRRGQGDTHPGMVVLLLDRHNVLAGRAGGGSDWSGKGGVADIGSSTTLQSGQYQPSMMTRVLGAQ